MVGKFHTVVRYCTRSSIYKVKNLILTAIDCDNTSGTSIDKYFPRKFQSHQYAITNPSEGKQIN